MKVVVFDLETKKTAQEVGGFQNAKDMGVSVIGAWRSDTAMYRLWSGDNLKEFIDWCNWADTIVGYNHIEFDYSVLAPFINSFELKKKINVDINQLVKSNTGRYHSLDKVAWGTLGIGKTVGVIGAEAPQLYKDGKLDLLYRYLLDDVQITVKLFYHILKFREIIIDGKSYSISENIASVVEEKLDEKQLTFL